MSSLSVDAGNQVFEWTFYNVYPGWGWTFLFKGDGSK